MKLIIIIAILCLNAFSDINFKETRHMDAIDIQREFLGSIKLDGENIVIIYTKPNMKTISYYENKVTIKSDDDQLKEYSFNEYPQAQYMGLILKAMVQDDYNSLDEFFDITQNKQTITLDAKAIIYATVGSIEVIKVGNVTKSIVMNMSNKDTIKIEIIK